MKGWAFYKRGVITEGRKKHHCYDNKWKSLCGHVTVRIEEQKFMNLVEESKLRQKKICKVCKDKLEIYLEYEKVINRLDV